jgi:hypothetical protein
MASRAFEPQPLDILLSAIPGLPRPLLDRLVARMIEHLDAIDGDADHEPDDFPEDDDPLEIDDLGGIGFWGTDQRRCIMPLLQYVVQ